MLAIATPNPTITTTKCGAYKCTLAWSNYGNIAQTQNYMLQSKLANSSSWVTISLITPHDKILHIQNTVKHNITTKHNLTMKHNITMNHNITTNHSITTIHNTTMKHNEAQRNTTHIHTPIT